MLKKSIFFILFIFFVSISLAFCQQIEDIFPDRPDQTESPDVMYRNFFQLEAGIKYEKNNSNPGIEQKNYSLPEMLLRYGLNKFTEIRLELNYAGEKNETNEIKESNYGLQPIVLGVKVNILGEGKFNPKTSLLLNLEMAGTGDKFFRTKHISPDLKLLFANDISEKMDLSYNLGINWDNDAKSKTGFYSVSLSVNPVKKFSFFVESYGYFTKSVNPDLRLDYGLAYTFMKNLQADISSGIGLTSSSPDYFIDFGFSARFPK